MSTQLIQAMLRNARHAIGTPYVWGGAAPGGYDCSGLIYWAYRKAGYSGIARTTYGQIKQGVRVNPRNIQAGDLVFSSPHHVGVYAGNGKIISAPHTGAEVHTIPLSQFGGIYQIRRLTQGGGGLRPPKVGRGGGQQMMRTPLQLPQTQPLQLPTPQAVLGQSPSTTLPALTLPQLPSLDQTAQASPQGQLDALRQRLLGAA